MQVSVESTEGLTRSIKVVVPAEEYSKAYLGVVRKYCKDKRVPGFRKGKVPVDIIEKNYYAQILDDVVNFVISNSMPKAIKDANVSNLSEALPVIEKVENGGKPSDADFIYQFSVEVYPEVDMAEGVDTIEFKKVNGEISEADIDKMIETLCLQQGVWEKADKAAEKNDLVRLHLENLSGDENLTKYFSENQALVVGNHYYIPGLEDSVVGHKVDDEYEFTSNFAADCPVSDLAGKSINFKVKVTEIQARKPAELNEELLKSFGVNGSIEDFRADVKKNMEREISSVMYRMNSNEVLSKLVEKYGNFSDLPEREIAQHIASMKKEDNQAPNIDQEAAEKLYRETAVNFVKRRLVVDAVCKKYDIKFDEERVSKLIDSIASAYDQSEEFKKAIMKDRAKLQNIRNRALVEEIVDVVLKNGKVNEEKKGFYDLVTPNN